MLVKLKQLQDEARVTGRPGGNEPAIEDDEDQFDEIGVSQEDADAADEMDTPRRDVGAVEREVLTLPSNGNVGGDLRELEIRERVKQARRQIARLRDLIADISFQYTHVIRNAPRKSNRTAAQKRVKALHNDLSYNARIYARCRSRLMTLRCDEEILRIFRILKREDLKASSEILHPNEQGSSSIKLSWIWRTGRYYLFRHDADADDDADHVLQDADDDAVADAATLLECE